MSGPVEPALLPDALAAYFQSYRDVGHAPEGSPIFDDGGPATWARATRDAHDELLANGLTDETTFRNGADEDGSFSFSAGEDRLLVCSTVRLTTVNRAQDPDGRVDVTDANDLFQSFVPRGTFARVERTGAIQTCFVVNGACSCVQVIGVAGGSTTARADDG